MKPTKFNPTQYQTRKAALTDLRKPAAPAASVQALRERVTLLEKAVGV